VYQTLTRCIAQVSCRARFTLSNVSIEHADPLVSLGFNSPDLRSGGLVIRMADGAIWWMGAIKVSSATDVGAVASATCQAVPSSVLRSACL